MGRTLLYILLLIALPAAAQIYKYTDASGNTSSCTFTVTVVFSPSNSFQTMVAPRGPVSTYGRVGLRSERPSGSGS